MFHRWLFIFHLFLIINIFASSPLSEKPHLIIIMTDDMGFNDIGFHGSNQIPTPNIDALAAYGISLNRMYTPPLCTPSRSALLTGKYPSNSGMQRFVLRSGEPYGLDLNEKLLPQYLKESGYATHMIGKWHLGFFQKKYTPCARGFDSFFGFLGPVVDAFHHHMKMPGIDTGYDMRDNFDISYKTNGTYVTELFTQKAVDKILQHPTTKNNQQPLFLYISHMAPHAIKCSVVQAPANEIAKFNYIKNPLRRTYAAMISIIDRGIGELIIALKQKDMLKNAIILFMSDNGAPTNGILANAGSNFPFRGQKNSPWDGGIRTPAAIWSPYLTQRQRVSHQLFHITDILPTFTYLAQNPIPTTDQHLIDGHNIWNTLSENHTNSRFDVLCHLDENVPMSAYIRSQWKYVNGSNFDGKYDNWLGDIDRTEEHLSFINYGQSIIESIAGKALAEFSPVPLLATEIELLRQQTHINCSLKPNIANYDKLSCDPLLAPCLFNILDDPCEQNNLAALYPTVLSMMENELNRYRQMALPARWKPLEPRSSPIFFNNTWTWWYDELGLDDNGDYAAGSINIQSIKLIIYSCFFILFWNKYYL